MKVSKVMQSTHSWFGHSFVVVILIFISQHQVLGQSNQAARWIYPTYISPRIYNYMDHVNASWITLWPTPWLHLWCTINEADLGNAQTQLYHERVPPAASSLIALDYGRAFNRCHFEITPTSATGKGVNSPNFDILEDDAREPVTWSLDSTTIASSISASTSTSTSNSVSTTSPNPPSSTVAPPSTPAPVPTLSSTPSGAAQSLSSRLSPAATAGIGLACSASVLALAGGAYYLIRRRRRRNFRNEIPSQMWEKSWWNEKDKDKDKDKDKETYEKKKKKGKSWRCLIKGLSQLSDVPDHQELDGVPVGELQG